MSDAGWDAVGGWSEETDVCGGTDEWRPIAWEMEPHRKPRVKSCRRRRVCVQERNVHPTMFVHAFPPPSMALVACQSAESVSLSPVRVSCPRYRVRHRFMSASRHASPALFPAVCSAGPPTGDAGDLSPPPLTQTQPDTSSTTPSRVTNLLTPHPRGRLL